MQFLTKYLVVYDVENATMQDDILRYEARWVLGATIYASCRYYRSSKSGVAGSRYDSIILTIE